MGRITRRWPITKLSVAESSTTRVDVLAVEEPLEIRVAGRPLVVTMRTPGRDVELAAGFLVSEGIVDRRGQFRTAIHCGGPGIGRAAGSGAGGGENTYNVLDLALDDVTLPGREHARTFYATSSCGVCGKASIDAVHTLSSYTPACDDTVVDAALVARLPDLLRAAQEVFDKTGGLHAAALFDADTGEMLVVREDVGRHNAVDKVIGWAYLADRLPLRRTILQVSGRASFELIQKAVMAGIPVLAAVSAPSSLAVELARDSGLTLVGFLRGQTMNVYTHPHRIDNPLTQRVRA